MSAQQRSAFSETVTFRVTGEDLLQARMQSTEAQLAENAAQLQVLQSRHKQLEARNTLLEKVADIHKQPAAFIVTNNNPWSWQVQSM